MLLCLCENGGQAEGAERVRFTISVLKLLALFRALTFILGYCHAVIIKMFFFKGFPSQIIGR